MKRNFSLASVIAISIATAITVAAGVVWTGGIRHGYGVDINTTKTLPDEVRPAAWYKSTPTSFADLAEQVSKSVVNIRTSKRMAGARMSPFPKFGPSDPFDDFFEKFFEGMPREQIAQSLGSGFIIDDDGTILTNNHVVSQAEEIEVGLLDGRKFKAKVLGTDQRSDIAVIKIETKEHLPYARIGSSKDIRPGDWAMAIGNPFGLENTVTVGVVSAKGRMIGGEAPYAKFIQTDASINPGNSGGPLFNLNGEVIGINTMIHAGGQGIGFAIPIDMARQMVPELIEKGSVSRGWLGVAVQEVTPELAKSFGLGKPEGALIAEVYADSPAAKAGLVRGDVVIEFNGERIEEPYDLSLFVGQAKPDTDAKLVILRKGKREELSVKVGKYEESQTAFKQPGKDVGKADVLGFVVRSIGLEDTKRLNVPANFKGVVVSRVEPDSPAAFADVRTDDIILEINDAKIQSIDDYGKAVDVLKKGDSVKLFLKRGHMSIYAAFKI